MKIAFNNSAVRYPLTGIGHLTIQNFEALQKIKNIEVVPYQQMNNIQNINSASSKNASFKKHMMNTIISFLSKWSWAQELNRFIKNKKMTKFCKTVQPHVFYEPNFLLSAKFSPSVSTIYDISFIRYPNTHPKARVKILTKNLKKSIENSKAIVTISEFSKQEIIDVFKVESEKIFVAHCSTPKNFKPHTEEETKATLAPLKLTYRKFILVVGTFEPRKNLKNVCLAYGELPESLRKKFPLVLCGARGWGKLDLPKNITQLIENNQIRILNYIGDQTLYHLTASARVSCYCSIYEGFGLPVLEAMQSGTPVITSNISSMPEVAGDAAILVDPMNYKEIRKGIQDVLTQDTLFALLINKGLKQAKQFNSEKSAAMIVKACQFALENQE